jgi:hypothetical protein
MAPIFYRDAQAALVTFDVTSHYSFDRAQWWINELKQKGPKNAIIILVRARSFFLLFVVAIVYALADVVPSTRWATRWTLFTGEW